MFRTKKALLFLFSGGMLLACGCGIGPFKQICRVLECAFYATGILDNVGVLTG